MVSYAEYPSTMPPSDFDLYPPHETYDLLATSQPYSFAPNTFADGPFCTTSLDSGSTIQAFSSVPRSQEFRFNVDPASNDSRPSFAHYSPDASPNSGSHSFDMQPPNLSNASESGASVSSSTMGSPSLSAPFQEPWTTMSTGLGLATPVLPKDPLSSGFDYDGLVTTDKPLGCVDPTLIQPFQSPLQYPASPYPDPHSTLSPHFPFVEQPPSPALSISSVHSQQRTDSRKFRGSGSQSPYLHTTTFQPYPSTRRPSASSIRSRSSRRSGSYELDDEAREKGLCPIPDCGRVFKDLKAHMLTHQNERPEKCPIVTCEYHVKGFARKYDKNRHTLTHYKGTMVCGFCPGSGSAAEKSFNRADVFKRHLTSVHGVEQNPPNSRKKSPSGKKGYNGSQNSAGTCSTCSVTFANAQEFYEHLDDCVLRVVQQADPSEAINQKLLNSVSEDKAVLDTMDRNGLPNTVDYTVPTYDEQDDDEDDEEEDDANDDTYGVRNSRGAKGANKKGSA